MIAELLIEWKGGYDQQIVFFSFSSFLSFRAHLYISLTCNRFLFLVSILPSFTFFVLIFFFARAHARLIHCLFSRVLRLSVLSNSDRKNENELLLVTKLNKNLYLPPHIILWTFSTQTMKQTNQPVDAEARRLKNTFWPIPHCGTWQQLLLLDTPDKEAKQKKSKIKIKKQIEMKKWNEK